MLTVVPRKKSHCVILLQFSTHFRSLQLRNDDGVDQFAAAEAAQVAGSGRQPEQDVGRAHAQQSTAQLVPGAAGRRYSVDRL